MKCPACGGPNMQIELLDPDVLECLDCQYQIVDANSVEDVKDREEDDEEPTFMDYCQ